MLLSDNRSNATEQTSLSYRVIEAVAEREGVDIIDIEPPMYESLYDVVNPEALDSLFASRENGAQRTTGSVEFEFCGYSVVVRSNGTVDILE